MRRRGKAKATVAVLFNQDFEPASVDYAARADVQNTAHAIAAALEGSDRYTAVLVPIVEPALSFVQSLEKLAPAVVFNLCESIVGNAQHEALVPALLDLLGLPYTGNGALTLATALRKDRTQELLQARDVPHPPSLVVADTLRHKPEFGFPAIVKPLREDGSLGISPQSIVTNLRELNQQALALIAAYHQPVLIQAYVDGREINVPLLGNASSDKGTVLPFGEVDFASMPDHLPKIVTYRGKWDEASAEYRGSVARVNPKLSLAQRKKIWLAAVGAFQALECDGYARIDLRLDAQGDAWVIDVNPNCDLSPQGGFFRACRAAGLTYSDMATRLVDLALEKRPIHGTSRSTSSGSRPRAA